MNCRTHGKIPLEMTVLFNNKKRSFRRCIICKRLKDRATSKKYREKHKEYYRLKGYEYRAQIKCLSLYLTMVLLATENCPVSTTGGAALL